MNECLPICQHSQVLVKMLALIFWYTINEQKCLQAKRQQIDRWVEKALQSSTWGRAINKAAQEIERTEMILNKAVGFSLKLLIFVITSCSFFSSEKLHLARGVLY